MAQLASCELAIQGGQSQLLGSEGLGTEMVRGPAALQLLPHTLQPGAPGTPDLAQSNTECRMRSLLPGPSIQYGEKTLG